MSPEPQRIVIVRLSHLGDVVQALPLFHASRAAHPRARIAWAVESAFAPLVAPLPGLARAIRFERHGGWSAAARFARDLADFGADLAIDAQGNLKSALATLATRAPRRVGYARSDWREPYGATALTESCDAGARVEHAVDRVLRLARHVAPRWDGVPRWDVALSADESAAGERAIRDLVHGEGGTLLHLSDPADVRGWPIARWAELARAAADDGPVLLVSGPAEERHGRALQDEVRHPRVAHLVGQRGLRELAALLAAAARRGMRFVGCDSGPLHLAWSSGLPVVVLAGPQDERRTGPWPPAGRAGSPHATARTSPALVCAPCRRRTCSHRDGPVCLATLDAPSVMARLAEVGAGRTAVG